MNKWKKRLILLGTTTIIIFAVVAVVVDVFNTNNFKQIVDDYSELPVVGDLKTFKELVKQGQNNYSSGGYRVDSAESITGATTNKSMDQVAPQSAQDYSTTNTQVARSR